MEMTSLERAALRRESELRAEYEKLEDENAALRRERGIADFLALRERLFAHIEELLAEDGHCKTYEGAMALHFPNYFEERYPDSASWRDGNYQVSLDCYLIGPTRHYTWRGHTLTEAIHKAGSDIDTWIREDKAREG